MKEEKKDSPIGTLWGWGKPYHGKFIGSIILYFDRRAQQFKAKPHAKSVAKFKRRMKELTCRSWGLLTVNVHLYFVI